MRARNFLWNGGMLFLVALMSGCGSETKFGNLYNGYFKNCKYCHAPDAPGRTSEIEETLDFSTEDTAYQTITQGRASGLVGNQEACNGVPFVSNTYETSLIAAVLDEEVRWNFSVGACDRDSISDMTVKVGRPPSSEFLSALKEWIETGTPR